MKNAIWVLVLTVTLTVFIACQVREKDEIDLALDAFEEHISMITNVQAGIDSQAELDTFWNTHELTLGQKLKFSRVKKRAKTRLEELKLEAREIFAETMTERFEKDFKEDFPYAKAYTMGRNSTILRISGFYEKVNVGLVGNIYTTNPAGQFYHTVRRDDELLESFRLVGFKKIVIVNYSDESNEGKDFIIDLD